MEEVSVDEIMEVCPSITNEMINYLEHFLYSLKDFEKEYIRSNISISTDLDNCVNEIEEWQKEYVEDAAKGVWKNVNFLQTINEEVEQQKTLQDNMLQQITKSSEVVGLLETKISNIKKKTDNLKDMRDAVQMCKLLTNASFAYKGSDVSGYIVSNRVDCFELDPEKLSKNDIMNCLYSLIKKGFSDAKGSE